MCADAGILLFTVFDNRCTASLLVTIFLEVVSISWIYGADNFLDHIQEMGMTLGMQRRGGIVRWFWKIMWVLITPGILVVIIILAWADHTPLKYEDYEFPQSIEALGWFIELGPLMFVFIFPLYDAIKMAREGHNAKYILNALIKPTTKSLQKQEGRPAEFATDNLAYKDN